MVFGTFTVSLQCDTPAVNGHRIRMDAQEVAKKFNGFIETSAKDNVMVESVFEQAVTLVSMYS